jgi:c-di-GMP-binding flagellar brake protein YcgR
VFVVVENLAVEDIFRPGDSVMLEFVDKGGVIKNYKTRIEDLDNDYLLLQMPIIKRVPVRIREGRELTIWRKEERNKQAYVTSVYVIENRPGKVSLLVCSKPKQISVTSRRRFFRCSVRLPLEYEVEKDYAAGTVTDLSLSGCFALVEAESQVKDGSILQMSIEIPGQTELCLVGEVIRAQSLAGNKKIGIAVDFREITEGMQDILNSYLFQRQRELIRKGVLFNQETDDDLLGPEEDSL